MSFVYETLVQLGYQLYPDKNGWRTNALYRNGDNKTSLKIYDNPTGIIWYDYVQNTRGTLEDLIKLTLGENINPSDWLKNKNITINYNLSTKKLEVPDFFDESILTDLIQDYSYFQNRGISLSTCELFRGGLCLGGSSVLGKLKNRQVLTVYDSENRIIGFTGRSILDKQPKWKHVGSIHNRAVYPAYINNKYIRESKEVILVESPLCCLKLYDSNIKNSLCLLGTECSHSILNYLLKINPKTIYISTNNELDGENGGVGNEAAKKIYSRLSRYFSHKQLKISLPPRKDFAECSNEEIINWYNNKYN